MQREEVFEVNMSTIQNHQINLYQCMKKQSLEKIQKNQLICDKKVAIDGTPILVLYEQESGRMIRLNSLYAPSRKAKLWGEFFDDMHFNQIIILYGLGDGLFALEIMKRLKHLSQLIIFEPSYDIFEYGLQNFTYHQLLAHVRVRLFVKGINDHYLDFFQQEVFHISNVEHVTVVAHPQFDEIFQQELKEVLLKTENNQERVLINRNTARRFYDKMIRSLFTNLKYLTEASTVSKVKEFWPTELPVILVSAGPSLNKNVDMLTKAKGKSIIMCVDAAINTLLDHNIIPDFIVSVEADKVGNLFQNPICNEIPLICILSSGQTLLSSHKGIKIFAKEEPMVERAYEYLGLKNAYYHLGGCVATATYAFAAEVGAKIVIMVGQDLAYGADGSTHSEVRNEQFVHDERYIVEDIYGNKIQSRHDWYIYIKWFENVLLNDSMPKIIDATEGGAKINRSIVMTLEDAINQHCTKEYDLNYLLCKCKPAISEEDEDKISEYYSECKKSLFQLKTAIDHMLPQFKLIDEEIKRGRYEGKMIIKFEKQLRKTNNIIMNALVYNIIDEVLAFMDVEKVKKYYSNDKRCQEKQDVFNEMSQMYSNILICIDYIMGTMNECGL